MKTLRLSAAFEAWALSRPSEISKVMMLAYLMGVLEALERDGELSAAAVKALATALEKHT